VKSVIQFAMALLLCAAIPASAATSELWGENGELWCPSSRLPDFSFAGYQSGEAAIPTPAVVTNVQDFGAVGDGIADDTAAFVAAIAAVDSGAILIPAGRYKITDVLYIRKSNVVLRGAGTGSTTLVFTNHLTALLGPPPGTDGLESWSWGGGLIWVEGIETNTTLADITANAERGTSVLTVSTTNGLSVGMTIRLTMTDPDGSLGRHIHADQLSANPALVGRQLVRFPSKITAISSNQITLERPLRLDVRTAWQPKIRSAVGQLNEVGLEDFTVEFPVKQYPGHFNEVGFNGIWMDGAWNSWIRNVTVTNAENSFMIERSVFCTLDQVNITANVANRRNVSGTYYTGHHGIQFRRSDDCMVRNFTVATRHYHDLTVEDATGCVCMKGSGVDLNFDHHTYLPYENLFTEINAGAGTRHWSSSGSAVPAAGARETFWNITSANPVTNLPSGLPRGHWPQQNVIGVTTTLATSKDPANAWIEAIAPANLYPTNLYEAQFARRLTPPVVTPMTLQWDGAGVGAAGAQGGIGNWNSGVTSNWWDGATNVVWPAFAGEDDNAIFGGTAGNVTNDPAGIVVNDVTINTAGYILWGGPLILNGSNATFSVNGGSMSQSEAVIAGACGLTKTGSSTLQLRAANRYQGDTRVQRGILLIGAANNRLPIGSRLILGEGTNSGTFQMNSRSQEVGGLITSGSSTNNRVINSSSSTSTFTVNVANDAATNVFNGTLGGTGANDNNYNFVKSGLGTLVLAGESTYTGSTMIGAGTLQIGNDGASGSLSAANVTNNGTLRFDRTGTVSVTNLISGTGSLRVDCPYTLGTVALRSANTFTGDVQITSGTLSLSNGATLGVGDKLVSLTTGFGTLRLEGANTVIPAGVTFNTSGEPSPGRIYNASGDNLIAGPLNLVLGAGTTLLASDGGSLNLAGNITAPLADRTLKLGGTSVGDNRITGRIYETNFWAIRVDKIGGGTWTLAGSNAHSGFTVLGVNLANSPFVSDGILRLANSAALGSGTLIVNGGYQAGRVELSGNVVINNPVSFYGRQGLTYPAISSFSGSNTLTGDINVIANGSSLNFESQFGLLTISGNPMTGASGRTLTLLGAGDGVFAKPITSAVVNDVRKYGNGSWTLAGTNTYTGSTTVNAGQLRVTGSLATTTVSVNSGRLSGSGIINGPVSIAAGAFIEPGISTNLAETLIINNHLTLAGTTVMQIGKSGITPVNDSIVGVTNITYGGTLLVTNATGGSFVGGDAFSLFSASGTKTGNFTNIVIAPVAPGLSASFNPTNGTLTLASTNVAPPMLSYITLGGGALQFSWTGSFKLQSQTNPLAVGLRTNWSDYPGGSASPVDVTNNGLPGTVFFRLAQP
jgi:autotransporter-associated beta strand protein